MAACSIPTAVYCTPVSPTPYIIDVGGSFEVVGRYVTNGSGVSCPASLSFVYELDGGPPNSWVPGSVDPAYENANYHETFHPTSPGLYEMYCTLVYRNDDADPVPYLILPHTNSFTLQVVGAAEGWTIERRAP